MLILLLGGCYQGYIANGDNDIIYTCSGNILYTLNTTSQETIEGVSLPGNFYLKSLLYLGNSMVLAASNNNNINVFYIINMVTNTIITYNDNPISYLPSTCKNYYYLYGYSYTQDGLGALVSCRDYISIQFNTTSFMNIITTITHIPTNLGTYHYHYH